MPARCSSRTASSSSATAKIGFLFGQYKRLANEFTGVLTGKGLGWGGSKIRPEATGYGAVYFAREMLATRDETLEGKRCLISGSGNVAQYAAEKLIEAGAVPVTFSDSGGYVYDPDGVDDEKLEFVMELKNVRRGRISEYADKYSGAKYTARDASLDDNPLWGHEAQCAFPCATQNEINEKDAKTMLGNGVYVVSEGANMPTVAEGVTHFVDAGILYGPGKAANAGGVAVSGLEMAQNSMRYAWTRRGSGRPAFPDHEAEIHSELHRDGGAMYDSPGATTWTGPTSPGSSRSRTLAFNAESVDITHAESAGHWRELLAGCGIRTARVAGAGIFKDANSDGIMRTAFFDGLIHAWQIIIPDFGTIDGPFQISALEFTGRHDGEVSFELSLESAGELTFTAL